MAERVLSRFKSKRNEVQLIQIDTDLVVRKCYFQKESFCREQMLYELLRSSGVPHACVTDFGPMWIQMHRLPGRNLVAILEEQEDIGQIDWLVWDKLVLWLTDFQKATGFVMTDVNLYNFLYDSKTETLYGVDFEECEKGLMNRTVALLAAYILNYDPPKTPIKQAITKYILQKFSYCLGCSLQDLILETQKQEIFLLNRRKNKG